MVPLLGAAGLGLVSSQQALDANGWYILPKAIDLQGCISALHGIPINIGAKPYASGVEEIRSQEAVIDIARRQAAAKEMAALKGPGAPPPSPQEVQNLVTQKEAQEKAAVQQGQKLAEEAKGVVANRGLFSETRTSDKAILQSSLVLHFPLHFPGLLLGGPLGLLLLRGPLGVVHQEVLGVVHQEVLELLRGKPEALLLQRKRRNPKQGLRSNRWNG